MLHFNSSPKPGRSRVRFDSSGGWEGLSIFNQIMIQDSFWSKVYLDTVEPIVLVYGVWVENESNYQPVGIQLLNFFSGYFHFSDLLFVNFSFLIYEVFICAFTISSNTVPEL
jgi:hypothetical protein